MLNLDKIAGERAQSLTQERQPWLDVVWSEGFQSLTARLSDGEVIELLALCTSAPDLTKVTLKLNAAPTDQGLTPFDWLKREAGAAGVSMSEWVRR